MVNVGHKPVQRRRALAKGKLVCQPATIRALKKRVLPKGDVLTVAQIAAGIGSRELETIFKICEHLSADSARMQKTAGTTPFDATYRIY